MTLQHNEKCPRSSSKKVTKRAPDVLFPFSVVSFNTGTPPKKRKGEISPLAGPIPGPSKLLAAAHVGGGGPGAARHGAEQIQRGAAERPQGPDRRAGGRKAAPTETEPCLALGKERGAAAPAVAVWYTTVVFCRWVPGSWSWCTICFGCFCSGFGVGTCCLGGFSILLELVPVGWVALKGRPVGWVALTGKPKGNWGSVLFLFRVGTRICWRGFKGKSKGKQ